jgi:hypothetical protein
MSSTATSMTTDLPVVIQLQEMTASEFITYYRKKKDSVDRQLLVNGAIKFSGVRINSIESFQEIVNAISEKFLAYVDGTSPRIKLSDNVYTSTEYVQTQKITMHNELSYSANWPGMIYFTCLQPAVSGGETLLADSREILKRMDKSLVAQIDKLGVAYIRNLHGGMGFGPSWKNSFETQDRKQLEAYCKSLGIEFEWKGDDNVKLTQRRKGIIEHRKTKEKVWFNQVDQFHPTQLGDEVYEAMKSIYESERDFPTYVTYGDGTEIDSAVVREILSVIEEVTIAPQWKKNELLLVDNELVCHGRNPFTGARKVLVSMSEQV